MKVFLIGMNGIGMQGIAVVLLAAGHQVHGWDDSQSELDSLKTDGAIYHNYIEPCDYVVYSSAIPTTHVLMQQARQLNIPCIQRTEFLIKHIPMNETKIIVAGAHGKTTTTSMIAHMLEAKSYFIGGVLNGQKHPAKNEKSQFTVIETDESDGSFVFWKADYKILTNFNFEHMHFFQTEQNAIDYHRKFILDDIEHTKLIIHSHANKFLGIPKHNNIITYGPRNDCAYSDYTYTDIQFKEDGLKFKINNEKITLPLQGEHNVSNFVAIFALFKELDLPWQSIKTFPGVKKRMQKIMTQNGHAIFSDYGHHPKEIGCVLKAWEQHKGYRVDVIIEPHKPSRLQYTWQEWPNALREHKVLVSDVYLATDQPIEGINAKSFINYLKTNGIEASYLPSFSNYKAEQDTICFSAGKLSYTLDKL